MAEQRRQITQDITPPSVAIEFAVKLSTMSICRSQRGAAIFRDNEVYAGGYNYKPLGFDCNGSDDCKRTCFEEAVHAEQHALISVEVSARKFDMLHVKTVGGALVPSGPPSCTQCSKLALASGIRYFWLYHDTGWQRYHMPDFHHRSILNARNKPIRLSAEQIHDLCHDLTNVSREQFEEGCRLHQLKLYGPKE